MGKKSVCYVKDRKGRLDLFDGQVIAIQDIEHVWGVGELGFSISENDPILDVTTVQFIDEAIEIAELRQRKKKISLKTKKIINNSDKKYWIEEGEQ